ncbi:FadR/GntR family transcriptional regulator [Aquamicrobium sp. LC103]|uniref:FadR/GntR family transcriptional regulator n=1 Tax=Aquamicrobium sp. LC103 TaxID=1120658 RepID=UPI00069B12FC|nr:FadR/GntR family transcriptional regulator [Aquamicrobium sp. LC103]TKT75713.1 FadR family transcriptional regulator [Aquamicrobium sp. LC103]
MHKGKLELQVVRPRRLYEQVADHVRELVLDGTFPPGSALPPERELAEIIGVSRPSIREALIALEVMGLVESRQGGGNFVRGDASSLRMIPLSKGRDLGPGPIEQFEARRTIELACAKLAAERASDEDILKLEQCLVRMRGLVSRNVSPAPEHKYFHTALANISQNQIFASTVAELWRVRDGKLWDTLRQKVDNNESWQLGIEFRERLIDAIRDRDSAAAAAIMAEHFDRMGALYFGLAPESGKTSREE